jgi:tetratricopeptide (TPR) repeat protein
MKKLSIAFIIFSILSACAVTFSPVLKCDFVNWDDNHYLLDNPLVKSLDFDNIIRIYRTSVFKIYSPLPIHSFAVEYHFFKLDPFIYHFNNLMLHLGVVGLIFWFCHQMGLSVPAAASAALLFGIHPMHVESVAWVSERKDVLYAFFYMLSLNCYLRYLALHKTRFYGLAALTGLLSILSKPTALSLPLIFYLCDWFKGRRFDRTAVIEKGWVLGYIVPIAWQSYISHQYSYATNWYDETLKVLWIFMFYIKKFLFPSPLNMFYDLPEPVSIFNPVYAATAAAFFLLVFLCVYFRRHKIFIFANLFYVLSIFFALRRVIEHSPGGAPFYGIENRFMYIPSLGYCLLVGWAIGRALEFYEKRGYAKCLMAVVLITIVFIFLSFTAFLQCRHWTNSMTLWDSVIARNPRVAIAYNNRGIEQKSDALALEDYNKCVSIDPYFIEAYFNRAAVLSRSGEYSLAIQDYTKCVQLYPEDAESYYLRAQNYYKLGDNDKAEADISKAKALGFPPAH